MTKVASPLKWHGGKGPLRKWLWSVAEPIIPTVIHSVETHGGALNWTLEGLSRGHQLSYVVNDLDGELMNFWSVLRDEAMFTEFRQMAEATPLSEGTWEEAYDEFEKGMPEHWSPVRRAWSFFVRIRQSLAGRGTQFTPLSKCRLRRGMNDQCSAWLGCVEGLPLAHAVLRQVVLLNRDALDVIRTEDSPDTLFYCDPPYLPSVRVSPAVYGTYEMSESDHISLLGTITACRGRVMISGYDSELYNDTLHGWTVHHIDVPVRSGHESVQRRADERVWCNF